MSPEQEFLRRAEDGDGSFAIAYALLCLANQVKYLGNGDAASPMGAIEAFGAHMGDKIDKIAEAIESLSNG